MKSTAIQTEERWESKSLTYALANLEAGGEKAFNHDWVVVIFTYDDEFDAFGFDTEEKAIKEALDEEDEWKFYGIYYKKQARNLKIKKEVESEPTR